MRGSVCLREVPCTVSWPLYVGLASLALARRPQLGQPLHPGLLSLSCWLPESHACRALASLLWPPVQMTPAFLTSALFAV